MRNFFKPPGGEVRNFSSTPSAEYLKKWMAQKNNYLNFLPFFNALCPWKPSWSERIFNIAKRMTQLVHFAMMVWFSANLIRIAMITPTHCLLWQGLSF